MTGQNAEYGGPQGPYGQPAQTEAQRFALLWEGRMRAAYAAQETLQPWLKLLIWASAHTYPCNFASVAIPRLFAGQLAALFRAQGFEVTLTDMPGSDSQIVTIWLPKAPKSQHQQTDEAA